MGCRALRWCRVAASLLVLLAVVAACGGHSRAAPVPVTTCSAALHGGLRSMGPPLRYDASYSSATNVVAGISDRDMWWFLADQAWHWDGQCWHDYGSPGVHRPTGALAFGPADVWLAGGDRFAHWDGRAWNATLKAPGSGETEVVTLAGTGDSDMWALDGPGESASVLKHFDGHTWSWVGTRQELGFNVIAGLAAPAPHQVWLSGEAERSDGHEDLEGPTLIRRGDGKHWQAVPLPGAERFNKLQIAARSDREVWLAGSGKDTGGDADLLRWDGTAWQRVPDPHGVAEQVLSYQQVIAPDGAGGLWIAGNGRVGHLASSGRWTMSPPYPPVPERWAKSDQQVDVYSGKGYGGGTDFSPVPFAIAPVPAGGAAGSAGVVWVAVTFDGSWGGGDDDNGAPQTRPFLDHYATVLRLAS